MLPTTTFGDPSGDRILETSNPNETNVKGKKIDALPNKKINNSLNFSSAKPLLVNDITTRAERLKKTTCTIE